MAKFKAGDKVVDSYGGKRTIVAVGEFKYFYKQSEYENYPAHEGTEFVEYADEYWKFDVVEPVKGEKWKGGTFFDYGVTVHSVTDGVVFYNQEEYPDEYFGTTLERFTEYFSQEVEDNG